jgi:hypothetical protein
MCACESSKPNPDAELEARLLWEENHHNGVYPGKYYELTTQFSGTSWKEMERNKALLFSPKTGFSQKFKNQHSRL